MVGVKIKKIYISYLILDSYKYM